MFNRPFALVGAAVCLVVGLATTAAAQLRSELYVSGLTTPLGFVQDPANPGVQYVVEQTGTIRVIKDQALLTTPFLDLSGAISTGGERGLLGLAFPPDYATSGRFFVNFTNPIGDTVVARFVRSAADPLRADRSSRFDLRWPSGDRFIAQPYPNHNGGHLVFGPDGYLYAGMGDGGSGNDPENHAQNPNSLLGKMLRVDVSVADSDPAGYRVPADNPFVGGVPIAALGEIWAFGLRNPWQFSFDTPALGGTGALIIGDVGQNAWEEIDYEPAGHGGRNYGWRNREGAHDNVTTIPPAYLPLTDPIFEIAHPTFDSITGGYVYRGLNLGSAFKGRYVFADFSTGRVWSIGLSIDGQGEATLVDVLDHTGALSAANALGNISAMGRDAHGELYLVNYTGGAVLRVASSPFAGPGNGGPATGTVNASETQLTYDGLTYPMVDGKVTFPDCTIFIALKHGILIPAGIASGCTPIGTVASVGAGSGGSAGGAAFVGPASGGPSIGTVNASETQFAYNGTIYPLVNGKVTFPDCAVYIALRIGLLIPAGTATGCTPSVSVGSGGAGGTGAIGGTGFVGPATGGPATGTVNASETQVTYNGVTYPLVNGKVTFPDCTLYIALRSGILIPAGMAVNCTPGAPS